MELLGNLIFYINIELLDRMLFGVPGSDILFGTYHKASVHR